MTDKSSTSNHNAAFDYSLKKINVELTNRCNLDCIMCSGRTVGDIGDMSMEFFQGIADEVPATGTYQVRYHWRGEPLLHPTWNDMVAYSKRVGVPCAALFTNAVLLEGQQRAAVFSSGVDELHISLDGTKKETNERIRRGLAYKTVEENIIKFLEDRAKEKRKLSVIMHMTLLDENFPEVFDFINKWSDVVDDVLVIEAWGYNSQVKIRDLWPEKQPTRPRLGNICRYLQERLFVAYDGRVYPCPVVPNEQLLLGSLANQSLTSIWTGPALHRLRVFHQENRKSELLPCRNCTLYGSAILSLQRGLLIR